MTDELSHAGKLMARVERIMRAEAARAKVEPERVEVPKLTEEQRLEREWLRIVDPVFRGATLEDLLPGVRAKAEEWLADPAGRNLVLAGDVGTGKSHAAMATARAAHMRGDRVEVWSTGDLWDGLRPGGPENLQQHVKYCDLLVLDDLGTDRATEWTTEQLYLIVDTRWRLLLPIIATTNLDPEELRAALGERVYDRLTGAVVAVKLSGATRRRDV